MEIVLPASQRTVRPGKLICIGRNYAKHVAELNNEMPGEPVVFLKPSTALVGDGGEVVLPSFSEDVHHEVELVLLVGRGGKNIPEPEALSCIEGYAVGLDMTARDVQSRAKAKGLPWSIAKGFDTFAPIGSFISADQVPDPQHLEIRLLINGQIRQQGNTNMMLFKLPFLISYCSKVFTLEPGDLIYTGTPAGVSQVKDGDQLVAEIDGFPSLHVSVVRHG